MKFLLLLIYPFFCVKVFQTTVDIAAEAIY